MNSTLRASLVAAALLLLFALTGVLMQRWLQRQAAATRAESMQSATKRTEVALQLHPRSPAEWDGEFRQQLGAIAGGRIDVLPSQATTTGPHGARVTAPRAVPGFPEWSFTVTLPATPEERFATLLGRSAVALCLLGLVVTLVPLALRLLTPRREADTNVPWKRDAASLEKFARLTVEQGAALEDEHGRRRRAEEDLQVSRTLLDHSEEERVRLGRELHDNISQTLYAVGLTIESVRKNLTGSGTNTERLDQSLAELRRLNREVRAYIRELEPENVAAQSFPAAFHAMLATAVAPEVAVDLRLPDEALALLPTESTPEIINLLREAVSNAVRHGRATRLQVHAAHDRGVLVLAVQDNGTGFDAAANVPGGHGLQNMRARAHELGGELAVESTPGKSTRVLLTLPATTAP